MSPSIRRSPARYGWLSGFVAGASILVFAPMFDGLDTNYLIPGHWKAVFAAVVIASIAGVFGFERSAIVWPFAQSLGVLCAYLVRVAIDGMHDRSSHNLLPFELIIDFCYLMIAGFVGSGMGYLARRRANDDDERGPWMPGWKRPP